MPELKGVEVKLLNVSASYDFRHEHSNLQVMFMHSMSFVEGESEQQVVYVDDKPQVIEMNKIQYIFIDFQRGGELTTSLKVDENVLNLIHFNYLWFVINVNYLLFTFALHKGH